MHVCLNEEGVILSEGIDSRGGGGEKEERNEDKNAEAS